MIFGTIGVGVVAIVSVTGVLIRKVVKDANKRESLKDLEKNIQDVLMSRAKENDDKNTNDADIDNNIEEKLGLDRSYKPINIKEKFKRNIEDRYKKDVMFDDYKDEYEDIDENQENNYYDGYENIKYKDEDTEDIDDSYEKMREFERNFFKRFKDDYTEYKNDIDYSDDLENNEEDKN